MAVELGLGGGMDQKVADDFDAKKFVNAQIAAE